MNRFFAATLLVPLLAVTSVSAQTDSFPSPDFEWRMIGPHRGGRTVAAAGIPEQPNVFFVGVNNGGVWKTNDYGRTWNPIFDDQPTGSIGDLALAPTDPNTIYVGTGEGLHRPDLSVGDGMFKSVDGGNTWSHIGLGDAQQIAAVIVDPRDADHVFVAALGHPYGPNTERGVFESTDGGMTWSKSLYIDEHTGAISVVFAPDNPDILYADMRAHREGPWENAKWVGETSGLFKSIDGGKNWSRLSVGLPSAENGLERIGIGIAPSEPSRIYATVQAEQGGGIYRSGDAGESWERVSSDYRIWGRGNDFAEIVVHPTNPDVVYAGNIASYRSDDGGYSWTSIKGAPGGDDYHGIWINPLQPEIMLFTADQGAVVTVNGGETWSSWYNQPTAQLYHVSTDNQFPYNVYGGQQESGAISIASRGNGGQISFRDWHGVGADEYSYVAPDPLNPDIVFGGRVTKFNRKTGQSQSVTPEALRSGKYRILRSMPLMFAPTDPNTLYFATNVLFKTTSGGQDWVPMSPDLSREKPGVTPSFAVYGEETVSRRGVIYALAPSPIDGNVIWAGTDDGLIHVTTDGGNSWNDVTPPEITSWAKISAIDAGHFDTATAYVAVNGIRIDDMNPRIYRTHDGGETWDLIVDGLEGGGPINVVREDPIAAGLLFAGSETQVFASTDDGQNWHSLRLNMPASSVRDLVVHGDDVVAGTHGRSIWILDNISALRQYETLAYDGGHFLFDPVTAIRVRWNMFADTPLPPEEPAGENPPDGAIFDYYLGDAASKVTLEVVDDNGFVVRAFASDDVPESLDPNDLPHPTYWIRPPQPLSKDPGMHRFVWDMRHEPPKGVRRSYPISAVFGQTPSGPNGPFVAPGEYTVRLTVDGVPFVRPFEVILDPRVESSDEAISKQHELAMRCYDAFNEVTRIRARAASVRAQIQSRMKNASVADRGDNLAELYEKLLSIEGEGLAENPDLSYSSVYEVEPGSETLAGLQEKFLFLMAIVDGADVMPTSQTLHGIVRLEATWDVVLSRWQAFLAQDLASANEYLVTLGVDPIAEN